MDWVGRDIKHHMVPTTQPWTRTPFTKQGCSELHTAWPWTLARMDGLFPIPVVGWIIPFHCCGKEQRTIIETGSWRHHQLNLPTAICTESLLSRKWLDMACCWEVRELIFWFSFAHSLWFHFIKFCPVLFSPPLSWWGVIEQLGGCLAARRGQTPELSYLIGFFEMLWWVLFWLDALLYL